MQLTTQRKIYLAVLALAGLGFGTDRCFFSPPPADAHAAVASAASTPALVSAAPHAASGPSAPEPADAGAVAQRLQAAQGDVELTSLRDVFSPTSAWTGAARLAPDKARAQAAETIERFRSGHHLLAVMNGGRVPLALVDGKVVHPGQRVDGFRLDQIGEHSVSFTSGDMTVDLHLPSRSPSTGHAGQVSIRQAQAGLAWEE
jgi:hypothetical protein